MIRKILCAALLLGCVLQLQAEVPPAIRRLLKASYMKGATFSIVVKDVKDGTVLYSYDAEREVTPASVLKTVTVATALDMLGSDYRYTTTLEHDGSIEEGVLKGNLYVRGGGDPSLGSSYFAPESSAFVAEWIDALKKEGIREITGAVVADEQLFDTEGVSPKWLREDIGSYYAPGSYGLSVFDNKYTLTLKTGAAGTRPEIVGTEPEIPSLRFTNRLMTASRDSAYIIGEPLTGERMLTGSVPAGRECYVLKGDIPDPALFLAEYLTRCLETKGITVGREPTCHRIEADAGRWKDMERRKIAETCSPTLGKIAYVTNHVSHNLFADVLLKTVGLEYEPHEREVISSFGRGVQVVRSHWKAKRLDVYPLRMYDGSGLASVDKVSAAFMADLLVYMSESSVAAGTFFESLPEAGMEGSVRNFLKGSKLQGKARLKSGSMTGVRSYAGYIDSGGKRYAVAVFANNYSCTTRQMTKALEELLLALF